MTDDRAVAKSALLSLSPRGLGREIAAAYLGISPWLFDEMVADGRMPKPKKINSRSVWDRWAIDVAFSTLPEDEKSKQKVRFAV